QASGRGRCDLLQRPKVDLGAGAGLAEGATGNDFSPLGRQVTDFLDLLRRESALRHEQSCLVLTSIYLVVFLLPCYHTPLRPAKGVLASIPRIPSFCPCFLRLRSYTQFLTLCRWRTRSVSRSLR